MPIHIEGFEGAEAKCVDPLDILKQEVRKALIKFAESTNGEYTVELNPEYSLLATLSNPTCGYALTDVSIKITREI